MEAALERFPDLAKELEEHRSVQAAFTALPSEELPGRIEANILREARLAVSEGAERAEQEPARSRSDITSSAAKAEKSKAKKFGRQSKVDEKHPSAVWTAPKVKCEATWSHSELDYLREEPEAVWKVMMNRIIRDTKLTNQIRQDNQTRQSCLSSAYQRASLLLLKRLKGQP